MTTTTRPILKSPVQKSPVQKKLYIVKLTAFKKNDHDLRLVIPAHSANEAWAYAQRQCWGFAYFIEAPQIFANKKAALLQDCL